MPQFAGAFNWTSVTLFGRICLRPGPFKTGPRHGERRAPLQAKAACSLRHQPRSDQPPSGKLSVGAIARGSAGAVVSAARLRAASPRAAAVLMAAVAEVVKGGEACRTTACLYGSACFRCDAPPLAVSRRRSLRDHSESLLLLLNVC